MRPIRRNFILLLILSIFTWIYFYYQLTDNNNNQYQIDRKPINKNQSSIGILLIVCNRLPLIESIINQLITVKQSTIESFRLRYGHNGNNTLQSTLESIPIIISQDKFCSNSLNVSKLLAKYLSENHVEKLYEYYFYRERNYNQIIQRKIYKKFFGYYRISLHYRWIFNQIFNRDYWYLDKLIVIEDDLQISPDFLEYFITLSSLIDKYPGEIYCISSWNDNGNPELIDSTAISKLYLTDFFPGLGWMLSRRLWSQELQHKWPEIFWDDWLRDPRQRKNRYCVRPEIARTSTVGSHGVSHGQFYENYLSKIRHYEDYYQFYDDHNRIKDELNPILFEKNFLNKVYNQSLTVNAYALKLMDLPLSIIRQQQLSTFNELSSFKDHKSLLIIYHTRIELIEYTKLFNLMYDVKYGVPRTAYKGIITFYFENLRVYLAPPPFRGDGKFFYLIDW